MRNILVPVDWSEASTCALDFGVSLAREHGSRLVVLHVVPLAFTMYDPPPDCYLQNLRQELAMVWPADAQTPVRRVLAEGDPAAVIIATAAENNCDLIVMGTHGRTGLGRLLPGSVAEEVVRRAPCPVITVKQPRPAAAAGDSKRVRFHAAT